MVGGISGLGTTFNLPNFLGLLYNVTPMDTKFTSAIGAINGPGQAAGVGESTLFSWQEEDLRAAARRTHPEGQDAPAATARKRSPVLNVLQIVHETLSISYTKLAAIGQYADVGSAHPNIAQVSGRNPVTNEMRKQITLMMKQIKRDIEFSAINARFNEPADNNTNRETRGLLEAATTNARDQNAAADTVSATGESTDDLFSTTDQGVLTTGDQVTLTAVTGGGGDGGDFETYRTYYVVSYSIDGGGAGTDTFSLADTLGGAAIDITVDITASTIVKNGALADKDQLFDVMQSIWEQGGIQEEETATLMANAWQRRKLSELFIGTDIYRQNSRTVGGVSVDTIQTDFGTVNVMLNRHMPKDRLAVVSLEWCQLEHLLIPNKGFLFVEPLGKDGARDESQIYGEWGLNYGNERAHGQLRALSFTEL